MRIHRLGISRCLAVLSVAAPILVACGDSSSAPTAPIAPKPTPARSRWSITEEWVTTSGPVCIFQPSVGSVYRTEYNVVRSGNTIEFLPPDPINDNSYIAVVEGANFAASVAVSRSENRICGRFTRTYVLSGSFSEDGNRLTANEVWSSAFDSGMTSTVTVRWSGVRL